MCIYINIYIYICKQISRFQSHDTSVSEFKSVVVCCSVLLQRVAVREVSCVAVCCSMLQYVAVRNFKCVAARCSVGFQVCCNVLQCAPHK